jgi:hypothetical protein
MIDFEQGIDTTTLAAAKQGQGSQILKENLNRREVLRKLDKVLALPVEKLNTLVPGDRELLMLWLLNEFDGESNDN